MRNQPKYNFFKNSSYALSGLKDIFKNEKSFQIEIGLALVLLPLIYFLDIEITKKILMFMSLMGVLIAETINSSIERVVDLVTLKHNEMAKRAKDAGSTIVFLSIIVFIVVWVLALK